MKKTNPKRNRIVLGRMLLTLLFLVPSVALADVVSVSDPGAAMEDSGNRTFDITLDVPSGSEVQVSYTITGDVDGTDYSLLSANPIPISAGNTTAQIVVQVNADT
ncbi:MAG: hypothetical protein PVJ53_05645, partial [Desulfobacterales bacterium]